ncbi:hypothetical protein [Nocardia sp. No.11]|uniref:hypothetical protein n=1 Tax=Nocardia sp. No.11 TaxID=3128861 RepID=UPI00319E211D
MSTLAHVIQVAICGGAVAGALVFLAAHWIHDALHPAMSATLGLGGEQLPDDEALCGWCGGGGCDECDPDAFRPDPGAEQDRARDRWIDGQMGVV